MTEEETEQSNKYNAKHYEPFEENEDIEFYFEPECFEEWLENTESKRGKHRRRFSSKFSLCKWRKARRIIWKAKLNYCKAIALN